MSRITRSLSHFLAVGCLVAAGSSHAALVGSTGTCTGSTFPTCDVSGLVTVDASFTMVGNGAQVNGTTLAPFFVASSVVSSTFGGVNSADVQTAAFEFGPSSNYTGILRLDFAQDISGLAFGSYQFDSPGEEVRLYDSADNLLGTFAATQGGTFPDIWTVTATAGERIARAELDGNFFSLNGLAVTFADQAQVPEPASLLLVGGALLGLATVRRRKAG